MTLLEAIKYLRESILDDTGGIGVDWRDIVEDDIDNHQLRWSNEELTSYINEAQRQAARAALLLKGRETTFAITVSAGTAKYSLDSRIIRLRGVESNTSGKNLTPAEYEDFIGWAKWREKTGTPTHYVIDDAGKEILLYPIPVADDTLYLSYYRLPLVELSWEISDRDLEIPSEYQIQMLDYAAYLAYMKDEANSLDPKKAAEHKGLFDANFSVTSAYSETRRRRTRHRPVRYRDVI